MIYYNNDLAFDRIFVRRDNKQIVTRIQDLKNQPLAHSIYTSPSGCPVANRLLARDGSCFDNYYIPTGAFTFTFDGNQVTTELIKPGIDLTAYTQAVDQDIEQQVRQAYASHDQVTLFYSGGIDSVVVLSYVMRLGLLARTRILFFENQPMNSEKKELVEAVLKLLEPDVLEIQRERIVMKDIADSFNSGSFVDLLCYATSAVMRRYPDRAYMGGFHGNRSLLHADMFIDEILLNNPNQTEDDYRLALRETPNYYLKRLQKYNIRRRSPLAMQYHSMKPWNQLDGYQGCRLYSPLVSDATMRLLRELDFATVNFATIVDARMAKDLVEKNVGSWFADYYGQEDQGDGDALLPTQVPSYLLDPKQLVIPLDLNHDPDGYKYLEFEIEQIHVNRYIPLNSLVAIKALQWIDQL